MDEPDDQAQSGLQHKLLAAKQRWAKEGRLLTGRIDPNRTRRLPPGQRETQDWPVLDLGITPRVHSDDWRFSAGGAVETPLQWSWRDFMAQPQLALRCDMHCVTSWSRFDNDFLGVPMLHLLDLVRPRPEAKFVMLRSFDDYTTNIPLSYLFDEDVLLAHSWQGRALDQEHGGPMRLILPKLYLWKSAKWLRHITFMEKDAPGYWEQRGYHRRGDPWTEERYG
jgi:DMSO/TMAO reductase YedYZ molybdopterin-dependent catalytic subunit